ncbi:MAG: bifunctional 5,10-methylenetetrahydrofolate dehydrogenase/5,10-methenyltetrahydrofolate cyclohydrolase [Patescibacteria group bacterium]
MAKILYGKPVRDKMAEELKEKVARLGFKPVLAIVQVGDREDSNIYVQNKIKFGEEIGVRVEVVHQRIMNYESRIKGEEEIIKEIKKLNKDENIKGIIVQLPLPQGLDTEKIINMIDYHKDADGLRVSDTRENNLLITPATARAVMALLDFYKIEIKNKKVAVIGRSRLAGSPIARTLEERGAKVEVCHKETSNTAEICRQSDILIVAAGQIGLVNKDFVNENQVVVDVGINRVMGEAEKPKLVGDVLFDEVEPLVSGITPVPGGVGPLTVACLFENLINLCYHNS